MARKKWFTKLDITTLIPTRIDSTTPTRVEWEVNDSDQKLLSNDTNRTLGSIGPPAARNRLTYDWETTNPGLPQRQGPKGRFAQAERNKGLASLTLYPPQILLIQEHHLGKEGIQNSAIGIEYWKGSSFWNEGIPMGRSQRTSAGTTILVDRAIAPLIKEHGILMEGCA